MNAKITRVEFAADSEFDLTPRYERELVEARFTELKDGLLDELIAETDTLPLHKRFEYAANEAAGLAWTTDYPLLVFPGLFNELARKERAKATRQERIRARSEMLLEAV